MRLGFDAKTLRSMYLSLGKEMLNFYNKPLTMLPPFSVKYLRQTDFFGFETNKPSTTIAYTNFSESDPTAARAVVLNRHYAPSLYEDEAINVMIHEVGHVIAGLDEQHGDEWARLVREFGGYDNATMVTRHAHKMRALRWMGAAALNVPPSLGPLPTF